MKAGDQKGPAAMASEWSRYRSLSGVSRWILRVLLLAIPLAAILYLTGVHMYFRIAVFHEQYVGLFLGLVLSATFLAVPRVAGRPETKVPWYDWILSAMGLTVGLYVAIYYPDLIMSIGQVTTTQALFGTVAILLILEAMRRTVGLVMVIVVGVFLAYAFVAPYMPGPLRGSATDPLRLVHYLYLDANSLLNMAGIGATIALAFIIFGQVLMDFGGGDLLNNLSMALFGRFRGGPSKAAIVGSSLVGTVTGGPVTNVLLTGSVTIPMMIRTGMSRVTAGAIEAAASSGGQLMPPVMGVAAFLIADNLGVPYTSVALAALVPALLYYINLFVQVDLIAARSRLHGLPSSEIPPITEVIRRYWMVFPPLLILLYTMFTLGYDPSTAAILSSGLAIPFLIVRPEMRSGIVKRIFGALEGSGRVTLEIGSVLAAAGLIVGVTAVSGLGFNLALALTRLGENNLPLLLIISAIVCAILGMGMHSAAAYALVAVMVGPAIINLDVHPLAAHLFIFYFAIVSNFTPPVALACFAAAPIAGASANRIGFEAMRLGATAYLVPFLFVYSPALILHGEPMEVVLSVTTAILGSSLLAMSLTGYMLTDVSWLQRILLGAAAVGLLVPVGSAQSFAWLANVGGLILGLAIWLQQRSAVKGAGRAQAAYPVGTGNHGGTFE